MDNLSDEVLMAFADGALSDVEHAHVAARLASEPALNARLQPFVVTRETLPLLFAEATAGPIPERLLKTVRDAPVAARAMASKTAFSAGFVENAIATLRDALFPSGLSLAHALTLAALFAGGTAAGWLAAHSRPARAPSSEIAFSDGQMYATGQLAQALETAPSAAPGSAVSNGTIAPLLTFAANDQRYCRQYELATSAGKHFTGFACREPSGSWQVVAHTGLGRTAGKEAARNETASGPGAQAVEAAIDRIGDGSRLETAAEAALIAKGWRTP